MITVRNFVNHPKSISIEKAKKIVCSKLSELSKQQDRALVITRNATKNELVVMAESILCMTDNKTYSELVV